MLKYHDLTVTSLYTSHDAVHLQLAVPDELRDEFVFRAGQHLPLQAEIDGKLVRRTYSICSAEGEHPLQLGIRIQPDGRFSSWAAAHLAVGDTIASAPPRGHFHTEPDAEAARTYVAFAAGSGITPVISNIRTLLSAEPDSRIVLFYSNRTQSSTMLIDALYALKNQHPARLSLHFLFSREPQEYPVLEGRLDGNKARELLAAFCSDLDVHAYLVCGPGDLLRELREALADLGVPEDKIHGERFGVARKREASAPAAERRADAAESVVTVIADGRRQTFSMKRTDNILDAAAASGMDLPYSCKAGVCSTCRTRVVSGKVALETNYALEDWELEDGFTLACQATPLTDEVTVDYDQA